jgi:hypothetical protein
MQAMQSAPVEAFLGPPPIVQRQPQKPENGVVDPVGVDLHASKLPQPVQTPPMSLAERTKLSRERKKDGHECSTAAGLKPNFQDAGLEPQVGDEGSGH